MKKIEYIKDTYLTKDHIDSFISVQNMIEKAIWKEMTADGNTYTWSATGTGTDGPALRVGKLEAELETAKKENAELKALVAKYKEMMDE